MLVKQIKNFFIYLDAIALKSNFHEVIPNRFYRSGKLSHKKLKHVVRRYNIKTVIDLRRSAAKLGSDGLTEQQFLEMLQVNYYHVPLNTGRRPSYPRIERLAECLKQVELPLLLHCTSGTHRSGLASFIWLLEYEGFGLNAALEQFSMRFGYVRTEQKIKRMLSGHRNLDTAIRDYLLARKQKELSFTAWAKHNLSPIETVGEKTRDLVPKNASKQLRKAS